MEMIVQREKLWFVCPECGYGRESEYAVNYCEHHAAGHHWLMQPQGPVFYTTNALLPKPEKPNG